VALSIKLFRRFVRCQLAVSELARLSPPETFANENQVVLRAEMLMRTGGCRCGKIRFLVEGEPLGGVACHCRDCQYMAGGSANLTWVFNDAGFKLADGVPSIYKAKPTSGGTYFCSQCGVQVFSRPDSNTTMVAIKVGAFDDAAGFKVQADMWMSAAPPWHAAHEGATQFEGNIPSDS
jgi:hypothetical protein